MATKSYEPLTHPLAGEQLNALIAQWEAEHGDAIIWKLIRKGFTRDEAEDALQDAWWKVARYLGKGAELRATRPAGITAWLLKIALRAAVAARQKIRRESGPWTEGHESAVVSNGVDSHTELCRRERTELVKAAIATLTAKQRQVMEAYRESGDQAQVAETLNLSPQSVCNLISRAKVTIREYLIKYSADVMM